MDEEFDPGIENANYVLAQESSTLFTILNNQSPTVILKLSEMIPGDIMLRINHSPSPAAALTERIKTMLEYFMVASAVDCCHFLQSVCLLCENIPMHLEMRLLSVAGFANIDVVETIPSLIVDDTIPGVTEDKSSSPLSAECQLLKRPRIDYWEQYISTVKSLLMSRWEQLSEHLVKEVSLENVWVSPRTTNRARDRPDQTPGSADRGSRTPEPYGDYGSSEAKVTLETFLQGCAGKVTVLLGQNGSGKTVLMSCLGQQWAHGLGPIPSSSLFVLLEFRQLSLISCSLSLSELLFHHYLPSRDDKEEKRAIMDYLISCPEQSCWVLDGYDEFHSKLTTQKVQKEALNPESPLSVTDLISGLLNGQLLPGCTVLVTCRAPCRELEGLSDKVGQLLGWGHHDIKQYVHNYFQEKGQEGHPGLGLQAADLLLSTRHLLAMSALPALCNVCCICLEHLLLQRRDAERKLMLEETGSKTKRRAIESHEKVIPMARDRRREESTRGLNLRLKPGVGERRESEDPVADVTKGAAQLPPIQAEIPSSLTQVYLSVVVAFLHRDPDKSGRAHPPNIMTLQQSTVFSLSQSQSELCELSQLAWRGLESNKALFREGDISPDVLKFALRTGFFSQVELRCESGTLTNYYCFNQLTLQEFLAALRIMTSQDVSDEQLKRRFYLKTRWTTKSDQRTVFDSLHLYVCGLASPQCTEALVTLARTSRGIGGKSLVLKRQALVLQLLNKICHSSNLTGPKILELCHCVQESQDHQLARQVVTTRHILELRNIRLLLNDIDALAFVVNSVGDNGIGLDFGACSMELEYLDDLPRCEYIESLCFRSRKYDDKFAEKLSSVLPKFKYLRKLEYCGASLSTTGAAALASALKKCPNITELNLSDNNLKDAGIKHIANVFTKLPRLNLVMLGRNNSSLKAVDYLIKKMSSCVNIQDIYADDMKTVDITFCQNIDLNCPNCTISLLNQKWSVPEMKNIASSLAHCPRLSVLNMSGGEWNLEILSTLSRFLPRFNVTKKITVNGSCSSVDGLVILTQLLSDCGAVMELHVRLQGSIQASILFSGERGETSGGEPSKMLYLSCCGLLPADLDKVWKSLGTSSDLTLLDLSGNSLGNQGLKKLLDFLPFLGSIQEINVCNNKITMEGVEILAGALCSHNNLTQVHIGHGGAEKLTLTFCPNKSHDKQQVKLFSINNSILLASNVAAICQRLLHCPSHLELDLSHSSLMDDAIENLVHFLPGMMSLQRLNVSHSIKSTAGALMLASCLTFSQRVTSVELRPQTESFIQFNSMTTKHTSCRFTHFSLNGHNLERLLEILKQAPHLSNLDLSSNQIDDKGLKRFLDALPTFQISGCVNLSNNSVTQQRLLDVANTLLTCENISVVDISISESGLECDHLLSLADIVSACPHLTKLEFKNNLLQPGWIENFVKLLSITDRRFSISIEEWWVRSEEAVRLVCRCLDLNSNIYSIMVHHTTLQLSLMKATEQMPVSDISADLIPLQATEKIGLIDCEVKGCHLASMTSIIQKCPSLTELDFSHNSLGLEGAEFLCSVLPSLPNLTSLSIASKETYVDEKLSEALLQTASLHYLDLSGHVIDDTAAQIISRVLPRLRSLNLSHCVWSATAGFHLMKALGECVSLEDLCLDSVLPDEESKVYLARSLRNLPSVRSLKLNKFAAAMEQLGGMGVADLLAAMEGLTKLEAVELDGCRMADRETELLSSILPAWTELKKLSLSKNLISDQSGDQLLGALSSCRNLKELYVSRNALGDLTAARMALVLPSLTHITVLDLSENHIGYKGSVSLSKAIMCLKNLTRILLTSVGTSELCAVVAGLASCPIIQDVGLGWNNCGDQVAMELAKVIPLCQKLARIDLESNSVTVVGAKALVRALQSCPALQLIRLWRNQISSIDADRLNMTDRRLNFSPT